MRATASSLSRGLLAACLVASWSAGAAELRIVAASAPGSSSDQLAQALKIALSDERGERSVEVTNVPGAGGTVGLAQFVAERGDGLLVTGLTMVDAAYTHRAPMPVDRLTPIARLTSEAFAVAVPAGSALRTIDDLRAVTQADAGRITWGGGPFGGIEHVATVLLAGALGPEGSRVSYVPFLSAAEAAGILPEGQLSAAMLPLGDVLAEARTGRLRLLAVSAPARIESLDVPTLIERGIALDLSNWRGVVARPDIEPDERARLTNRISRLAGSRAWRDLLERRGWQGAYLGPDEFGPFIRQEQARVKAALKTIGLLKRRGD